jgi:hypothetical protein
MFCHKCGTDLPENSKFCHKCGQKIESIKEKEGADVVANKEDNSKTEQPIIDNKKTKNKVLSYILSFIVFIFVVSFFKGVASSIIKYTQKDNKQVASQMMKDVLNDTNESTGEAKKYTEIMKSVFEYYKMAVSELFPSDRKIQESNVLTMESYKTKENLTLIIGYLNDSIAEFSDYNNRIVVVKNNAIAKINESDLSASDKQDLADSFRKGLDDEEANKLANERIQALVTHTKSILKIYQFLLKNFNEYEINSDENGEENIYFTSDNLINAYNTLAEESQKSLTNYESANQKFVDYQSKKLKDAGIDINVGEIQNYFNK